MSSDFSPSISNVILHILSGDSEISPGNAFLRPHGSSSTPVHLLDIQRTLAMPLIANVTAGAVPLIASADDGNSLIAISIARKPSSANVNADQTLSAIVVAANFQPSAEWQAQTFSLVIANAGPSRANAGPAPAIAIANPPSFSFKFDDRGTILSSNPQYYIYSTG